MKVSKLNNIYFKENIKNTSVSSNPDNRSEVKELCNVTPDYNIKTPVSYKEIGVSKLDNGLDIFQYKLSNGYKVTIVPMEDSPAVVKTYVNVGSMNETQKIKGISHFLEHMAFNGTNGENGHIKLETGDSFKKIDEIGGWANASTNYAITDYVNSSPQLKNDDLETQIKVISAMTEDLKLSDDMIKKEKGPVSSEINMIMDSPQTIAMDQTVRTLFNIKNSADELVGGSVEYIQNLTREDVLNYYNKYYTPDNINIVVTGDVQPENVMALISKNFVLNKVSKGRKFEEKMEPIKSTVRKDFVSDKATSTDIVLGFAGAKNCNTREKVLYDLVCTYLSSHSSGLEKDLKQYNAYPIIADEKISTNPNANRLGYIILSTADKNTENVLGSIYKSLSKKTQIDDKSLDIIKQKLLNIIDKEREHSIIVNDMIGKAVLDNDLEYVTNYSNIVNSITADEFNNAVSRFFNPDKMAITVVHPVKNDNISFKGASADKKPVNMSKVCLNTLDNNYEIGLYKTKNNTINVNMVLFPDIPYNEKPAVSSVLSEILNMGIKNHMDEDEYRTFLDKNNISLNVTSSNSKMEFALNTDNNNYQKGLSLLQQLYENPAINEENLEKAKSIVKDSLERVQDSAYSLYNTHAAIDNPYCFTKEEMLNSIDSITLEDVINCYDYIKNNSKGIVVANLPQNTAQQVKFDIEDTFGKFKSVKENKYNELDIYKEEPQTIVLSKENSNSQADIMESFRFKYDSTLKNIVSLNLMNSILSGSSIGLFDILREKENLAYSVHSDIDVMGNQGVINLNILTTTDNKSIGEVSFDNVQKSINGFNRQIGELIDGKFTDADLENAKLTMKAMLLNNEGNASKLCSLAGGMASKFGADYENQLFKHIDNITKEDIINCAKEVFSHKPVYSITASKDTLDYNKEFLDGLKC